MPSFSCWLLSLSQPYTTLMSVYWEPCWWVVLWAFTAWLIVSNLHSTPDSTPRKRLLQEIVNKYKNEDDRTFKLMSWSPPTLTELATLSAITALWRQGRYVQTCFLYMFLPRYDFFRTTTCVSRKSIVWRAVAQNILVQFVFESR